MLTRHFRWTNAWCARAPLSALHVAKSVCCGAAALRNVVPWRVPTALATLKPFLLGGASLARRLQLLSPEPASFRDMAADGATLASLGVTHGSLVYFRYTVERASVTPSAAVETRPYGALVTRAAAVSPRVSVSRVVRVQAPT